MKKLKICHVNMFYLPTFGGVEQVMYELAQRQVKEGHEVHVYCCDSDKNQRLKIKNEMIEGVRVHRLPYWFRLSLNTFIWPSLLWDFKEKFDVVHTHVSGHLYISIIGILSRLKGFKHVHTTHCPWTDSSFRPKIIRPLLFLNELFFNKIAFKMIDKIIAITPWELDTLNKYLTKKNKENKDDEYKIKEKIFNKNEINKVIVIRNGTDKIFYKKLINNNFKENNNIKEKYLVLFFGRLNPTKGPEMLAKAAIEITKKRKDIAFVWVGPDEGKADEVKKIIKSFSNMYYLGPIRGKDKVAEMYQAADIYVLPSYREGLPLTLFEAMASGLPIVASPVNGIPYEMSEPENGFFANYGDIKKLEEKILMLINSPKIAKEISLKNFEKSKNYDWDNIYKEYMGEYEKLLKK